MSKDTLDSLVLVPDIANLRQQFAEDAYVKAIQAENNKVVNALSVILTLDPPVLDCSVASVQQINAWLSTLQKHRDHIVYYLSLLDDWEFHVQQYWSTAYSVSMIQSQIEALRSGDHKEAYINQLFENILKLKRTLALTRKKIGLINDNLTNHFFSIQQQQKNLMLVTSQIRPQL